jgi:hypothetical protein
MAERYVLRGSVRGEPIAAEPFGTLQAALDKAGDLFGDHASDDLELEIYLNDQPPPLFNTRWMKDWAQGGRPPVGE